MLEGETRRLRQVDGDGTIHTLERIHGGDADLVGMPDGRVLVIDDQLPRWLGSRGPAFAGRDVVGRRYDCVDAAAADGTSLLLAGCGGVLWWLPGDTAASLARRAIAIRDLRVGRTLTSVEAEAAAPGTVELRVDSRTLASRPIVAGRVRFHSRHRLALGWHRIELNMQAGWGDAVRVWGGGRLRRRDARC